MTKQKCKNKCNHREKSGLAGGIIREYWYDHQTDPKLDKIILVISDN